MWMKLVEELQVRQCVELMLQVAQEEWHCKQLISLMKKPGSVHEPHVEVSGRKYTPATYGQEVHWLDSEPVQVAQDASQQ